jgi:hypothetical protein
MQTIKKFFTLAFIVTTLSCSPYQRLIVNPTHLNSVLKDSCDLLVMKQLKYVLDTNEFYPDNQQDMDFKEMAINTDCRYDASRLYPPSIIDSAIWLMTIRPVTVGKDEIILGSLYTVDQMQDSVYVLHRRIKEYQQKKDFESGRYMVFTYFIENDSTSIVKLGRRKY